MYFTTAMPNASSSSLSFKSSDIILLSRILDINQYVPFQSHGIIKLAIRSWILQNSNILTHRLPPLEAGLSNSYLATRANFWGFNCSWRHSTFVSYARGSSLNNIGAMKSFASWYFSVGRLDNRTAFFCFDSVTPLNTKKNSSCSAYASKSVSTANL